MATINSDISKRIALDSELQKQGTIGGVIACTGFIGFFIVMNLLGLGGEVWLRAVNGIILALSILMILRSVQQQNHGNFDFLLGLRLGLRITLISVIPFSLFMFLSLTLNNDLLLYIQDNSWFGAYITPVSAAGMLCIEGIASGFIMSYIYMMRFKSS